MTNSEAIFFAAKVTVGTLLKANNMIMRVDEIRKDSFAGQTIYKGKERGLTFLSFSTLTNPHYGNIEIIENV